MSLLPVVVPDIPEDRSRVVAARLARKIAPLFGVPWPDGPFGPASWVGDYNRITLTEIARGAPLPTRDQARTLPPPDYGWRVADRVALSARGAALPHEIANATLNRFGPDTRAAVVLTGVNRLLEPVHDAVVTAIGLLVDEAGAPLPTATVLTGWLACLIETFRTQPALVAAGIRARSIQAQLCTEWDLPPSWRGAGPLSRIEISAPVTGRAETRPDTLPLVDDGVRRVLGSDGGSPEAAEILCARLLAVGTLGDSSHLWLAERAPGALAVEAYLPPTELIDRLVHRLVRGRDDRSGDSGGPVVLPTVPASERFAALPLLTRRALVVAVLGVVRWVQFDPLSRERSRRDVLALLDRLTEAVDAGLPVDDPVGAVARCRIATVRVQTRRYDRNDDLGPAARALMAAADHCAGLADRRILDRGAAAEALSAANIELNVLRWSGTEPGPGPGPVELDRHLRRSWRRYLELLDLDGAGPPPGPAGFHLHNHAAFLASHTDRDDDLRAAAELFGSVVIPAREAFRDRTGSGGPLRHSLQVGSRATTALARRATTAGEARRWAALGREWIGRALADPGTVRLLASAPTEIGCRFVLQAAPALLTALDHGVGADGDRALVADLLGFARRWEETLGDPQRHARHDELAALTARLTATAG